MLEIWGNMTLEGGATDYRYFTPRMFNTPEDAWCVQRWPEEHASGQNPYYNMVGLGAWKIVLLRKMLEASQDGEIITFHDCNFVKTSNMRLFARNIRAYSEAVMKLTDFFMPFHDTSGRFTSAKTFSLIPSEEMRNAVARAPIGRGRAVIIRVNSKTRDFMKMVEETTKSNPFLLSPIGSSGYPGSIFSHHTHEQTVLSILAYREGFFPHEWRNTWVDKLREVGNQPGCGFKTVLEYAALR